ncbi:hypothetical protein MKC54_10265 [[Clostridium] innocuum]|nr:hypothetical protein [[Clostridium] innocuum]MCR0577270.1 hypothetical protein [[Clostridium] innocuum]
MNSRKKQTVAVAMATALGASAMMSPVAVHAQEEDLATAITQENNQQESKQEVKSQNDTPVSEQGLPASEQPQELNTNSLSSGKPIIQSRANVAFTDYDEARQAIETALADYPVSNATTRQEIQDFLAKEFVATGKLGDISVIVQSQTDANPDSTGTIEIRVAPSPVVSVPQFDGRNQFLTSLIIPRLPKNGEVAIDKANFPDDSFRKYVSDNCDTVKDGVLSITELSAVVGINIPYQNAANVKDMKGTEFFENLESLNCSFTSITELDISKNRALKTLNCIGINIPEINVENNPLLETLNCTNSGITKLDVSNNPLIKDLNCYNTRILELNLEKNTNLKTLDCGYTNIKELNLHNNTGLTELFCHNTGIQTLDVSNNTDLSILHCFNTPLAYLNLGNHLSLNNANIDKPTPSVIDLIVTSDSFDMTQAFQGIDISKVTNITGATLDGNRITGYTLGKPITYTYDCGTAQGNSVTLDVTLNLVKSDSTIQITGNLDMTYTGKTIVNPSVSSTGSKGAVTFTYEKWNGSAWEVFSEMPTDAGRYRVQAHLASDDFNNEAVSEKKEFTITQATNSWKNEPAIADWTYGGQPNSPTATAKFGNAIFTYSDSKTGTFTSNVPVNAGTWYVKATVAGTNNYTGLESIYAFTILPKDIKDGNITVSDINNDSDVKKLSVKDDDRELVKGTDYDVETKRVGNKITVTIIFKGNYAGTIERTYTVETNQPEIPEKPEQKPQQDKPQEKPKDSTQANSKEKPKNTEHVKTGDTTQTGLFATLGVLSAGCIALLAGKKRKKSMKEDETTTQ